LDRFLGDKEYVERSYDIDFELAKMKLAGK